MNYALIMRLEQVRNTTGIVCNHHAHHRDLIFVGIGCVQHVFRNGERLGISFDFISSKLPSSPWRIRSTSAAEKLAVSGAICAAHAASSGVVLHCGPYHSEQCQQH